MGTFIGESAAGAIRRRSMATLAEQLAKALLREHGHALCEVAVVLPSQRAGMLPCAMHWHDKQAERSELRGLFTLSSFMERLRFAHVADGRLLLRHMKPTAPWPAWKRVLWKDFIDWAPVTLADMSEADANMVRLDGFYRDLRSWEELDWSFNVDPLQRWPTAHGALLGIGRETCIWR